VVRVPAAYTTQTCSNILRNGQMCGTRVKKSLSVRTHICPSCGYIADRDHNAAATIKHKGLSYRRADGNELEATRANA
jgi:putative transposase